jgi:hypothetical protein
MNRHSRDRIDDRWQVAPGGVDGGPARIGLYLGPIRLTPTLTVLVIALVGSLAYIGFALTVRDTSQIPMLVSGAAILGVVFVALAIAGAIQAYQAGVEGRAGRAFGLAVGGGLAAMIGFICFAFAIVFALVYQQ